MFKFSFYLLSIAFLQYCVQRYKIFLISPCFFLANTDTLLDFALFFLVFASFSRIWVGCAFALPSLILRSTFALPPYQSRCKVGGGPILNGSCIEFGTESHGSYKEVIRQYLIWIVFLLTFLQNFTKHSCIIRKKLLLLSSILESTDN